MRRSAPPPAWKPMIPHHACPAPRKQRSRERPRNCWVFGPDRPVSAGGMGPRRLTHGRTGGERRSQEDADRDLLPHPEALPFPRFRGRSRVDSRGESSRRREDVTGALRRAPRPLRLAQARHLPRSGGGSSMALVRFDLQRCAAGWARQAPATRAWMRRCPRSAQRRVLYATMRPKRGGSPLPRPHHPGGEGARGWGPSPPQNERSSPLIAARKTTRDAGGAEGPSLYRM